VVVANSLNARLPSRHVTAGPERAPHRSKSWIAKASVFTSGYSSKHAELVGPACGGAVTHPGGAAETKCSGDI
jgi:dihydroxy-acid dehydratase